MEIIKDVVLYSSFIIAAWQIVVMWHNDEVENKEGYRK